MVRSLHLLLLIDPRFLQHVGHDVATIQLTRGRTSGERQQPDTWRRFPGPELHQTLHVPASLGTRDPNRLLTVVGGLLAVLPLHVYGGQEVLRGVGVLCALHKLDVAGRHLIPLWI